MSTEERGVFRRLQDATSLVRAARTLMRERALGRPDQLSHFDPAECARYAVKYIESLDYFMLDMKNECLIRYCKKRDGLQIDCSGACMTWVVIQAALTLLSGNAAVFIISDNATKDLLCDCLDSIGADTTGNIAVTDDAISLENGKDAQCSLSANCFTYSPIQFNESNNQVIVPSIRPSLDQMLDKEVESLGYLQEKYDVGLSELMDEFDLLDDIERDKFVKERSTYLLCEVRKSSAYYASTLTSDDLLCAPCISGRTLLEHVHPYGDTLLSTGGSVHTPNGHNSYAVSFASGGSTGLMKFVYRTEWEDQENARYLGKGLYASGLRQSDVVVNFLSAGFWGGMHVFNLALSYIGCAVIPLGPTFSSSDVINFLIKLKPTAVLGMPSFVMTLADHMTQMHEEMKGPSKINDVVIRKVITGGEMLLPEMENRIRQIFHVESFLSTGYTSNETGAIGFRCRHLPNSFFHIHENMQHVTLTSLDADSMTTVVGGVGKIIATNLNRTLMPTVKYEIGDMGRFVALDDAPADSPRCHCGRRLRLLELLGRCDNRIRVGAEDLYLEEIPKCLETVNGLSLIFSLRVTKSARQFDHIILSVEAVSTSIAENSIECERIRNDLLQALGRQTQLVWHLSQDQNNYDTTLVNMMQKKIKPSEACIETPDIIVYAPNSLPRNPRTGKIVLLKDER